MGENAEIEYSITEGEGLDMFDVVTDQETQEGVITVKKVMPFVNYHANETFAFLQSLSNQDNYGSHERSSRFLFY